MKVRAIKTGIFREGEDLLAFIKKYVQTLKEGSVLIVTSKIVALAEGRTAPATDLKRVIKAESTWAVPSKYVMLTEKDGMLLANAGVDASNGDGKLVLLPKDSFKTAAVLRKQLLKLFLIRKIGVVIADSRCVPGRAGIVGVALGYAGFKGLRDYKGKKDIFGRKLRFTQTDIADGLATAAVLVMGEGSERQPLCVIEDAPVVFAKRVRRNELRILPKDDMFRPILQLPKTSGRKRRKTS